mgnify:CR=1 FL=1
MTTFSLIIPYALIPVISMLAGGFVGLYTKTSGAFRSSVLHFAAGVVFSVVAVELLPDIIKNHRPIEVGIGFSLGIATMLLVKFFAEKIESKAEEKKKENALPIGLLLALGIDLLIDGLLLGVGFAAGNTEGILLSVALALETFSLGLAVVLACVDANLTKQKKYTNSTRFRWIIFYWCRFRHYIIIRLIARMVRVSIVFWFSRITFFSN